MTSMFSERIRAAFAPPSYMAAPFAGIDLSTSGVKAVRLAPSAHGLVLAGYAESWLPAGAFTDGEVTDQDAVIEAINSAAEAAGIATAHVALPESKSYLFEIVVPGKDKLEWRTAVEQRLDELVPLPPAETAFDIVGVGRDSQGDMRVAGVGFARRIVDDTLAVFDQSELRVASLEGETFASARALFSRGDESTTLVIDVGKTTTKISIVAGRIPRFATTINIGGHALTLAVQKYFGVTEEEARKVKAQRGIVSAAGNEEYIAAMLSTASAIRAEIARRLDYWQERAIPGGVHQPVTRALLVGGNASLRGFPEYLENTLRIPVAAGDVFTNLASRDTWVPALDYTESLAYATAIGLALRDTAQSYAG